MEQIDIVQVIGFIPEPYRSWLIALALLVMTLSYSLAAIKKATGYKTPDPKAGPVQFVGFWLLHIAELGAGNSTTYKTLVTQLQRSKKFKVPPPMPLFLLAVLCSSCATTQAISIAAKTSNAAHDALAAVGAEILSQALAEEDAAIKASAYEQDAHAALAQVRERWRPIEVAYEKARLAHTAFADAVQLAQDTRTKPPAQQALALLSAWQSMSGAAKAIGVNVPSPPDALRALTGGVL